jgi:hypothetical protein
LIFKVVRCTLSQSVSFISKLQAVSAALILSACMNHGPATGPEQHVSRSVELDNSERVRVELKMSAGEMDVQGGARNLLDADFTWNVEAWKPRMDRKSDRVESTGSLLSTPIGY